MTGRFDPTVSTGPIARIRPVIPQFRSERVRRAVVNLACHTRYAKSATGASIHLHIVAAAQRHGVFEPFEADAHELNDWLRAVRAGRTLCRDAWASFAAEGPFDLRVPRKTG